MSRKNEGKDMKKNLIALCSATLIFAVSMLTPATALAGENSYCDHVFNTNYTGFVTVPSTHLVGSETCYVNTVYYGSFPKCSKCGAIDNNVPKTWVSETHSICNH
jgi:hypothetical protein